MPDRFVYFAYGSNMLTERLRARCPSATPLGRAVFADHGLCFSKISTDGSGKATPQAAAGAHLYGVLFEIAYTDLPALDRAEGAGDGYDRCAIAVQGGAGGEAVDAVTYLATRTDPQLRPYDWYRALALAGAIQHRLPAAHQEIIRTTSFASDMQTARPARVAALEALQSAKFGYLLASNRKTRQR